MKTAEGVKRVTRSWTTKRERKKTLTENCGKGKEKSPGGVRNTINRKPTCNSESLRQLLHEEHVIFPSSRQACCTFRRSCAPWRLLYSISAGTPYLARSLCRNNC